MATATTDALPNASDLQQQQRHDIDGDADEQVTDSSRIWSAGVLLELVHIWRRVELAHPGLGRVAKAQLVYDEFSEKVDRGGSSDNGIGGASGAAKRSRKAVEDKLYTMKQMYRFIIEMNRDFGRQRSERSNSYLRSWFDLTRLERRAVRSLHGIRIPNISLEVFLVLDSVLHGGSQTGAKQKVKVQQQPQDAIEYKPLLLPTSLTTNDIEEEEEDGGGDGISQECVFDRKRNWSADATMQLAKIWGDIQRALPNLRGAYLSDQVYSMFKAKAGDSLSRSQKAVEEKMQSMKEMYRFIKNYDDTRGAIESDGTGGLLMKPSWFELTKAERRQLRRINKIRVTNLSRELFDQVAAIMSVRAETEAAFLEMTGQQPAVPSTSTSVVQTQQQTEARSEGNAGNSTQSSGVLGAMEGVIAQELRASSTSNRDNPQPTLRVEAAAPTTTTRAQKRPRADGLSSTSHATRASEPPATRSCAIGGVDRATANYLLEEIRALHEEDRAERRQQHAEHMAAIRELADLLKTSQQQQQQSSAVTREAEVEDL